MFRVSATVDGCSTSYVGFESADEAWAYARSEELADAKVLDAQGAEVPESSGPSSDLSPEEVKFVAQVNRLDVPDGTGFLLITFKTDGFAYGYMYHPDDWDRTTVLESLSDIAVDALCGVFEENGYDPDADGASAAEEALSQGWTEVSGGLRSDFGTVMQGPMGLWAAVPSGHDDNGDGLALFGSQEDAKLFLVAKAATANVEDVD